MNIKNFTKEHHHRVHLAVSSTTEEWEDFERRLDNGAEIISTVSTGYGGICYIIKEYTNYSEYKKFYKTLLHEKVCLANKLDEIGELWEVGVDGMTGKVKWSNGVIGVMNPSNVYFINSNWKELSERKYPKQNNHE